MTTGMSRERMEGEMVMRQLVPAARGAGLRLKRGEQLRVIDPEGGQPVGVLWE
jgi:uncharacterized protein YcgI (DUF1989 family)